MIFLSSSKKTTLARKLRLLLQHPRQSLFINQPTRLYIYIYSTKLQIVINTVRNNYTLLEDIHINSKDLLLVIQFFQNAYNALLMSELTHGHV
jgi:hypothetical protein